MLPLGKRRIYSSPVIAKVMPPVQTNEPCLAGKELTIDAVATGYYLSLPFPQRPVPATIGKHHIAAIVTHDVLSRETTYATVEQRQETNLLHHFRELRTVMYIFIFHVCHSQENYLYKASRQSYIFTKKQRNKSQVNIKTNGKNKIISKKTTKTFADYKEMPTFAPANNKVP